MIQRLERLRLDGYRGFRDSADIPLNADVVLIFGENGSGKSSIISAIEYALTGDVRELKRLGGDYPRSLTHVGCSGSATVSVDATLDEGRHATFGVPEGQQLPSDLVRKHFLEHCYLPQSQLRDLISTYQASADGSSERGLSRFIRELLGLGVLDAITDGLHEAGDVRRLRRGVEEYEVLHNEIRRLESVSNRFDSELSHARAKLEESIAKSRALCVEAGLETLPWDDLDSVRIRALLNDLRAAEASSGKEGSLSRLRRAEAAVQRIEFSLAEPPHAVRAPDDLREDQQALMAREQGLLELLKQLLVRGWDVTGEDPDYQTDVLGGLRALEERNREEIQRLEQMKASRGRLTERRAKLGYEMDELTEQLRAVSTNTAGDVARAEQWAETLRRVLAQIDGNTCPVCGRDFSEVGDKTLHRHVADELAQLEQEVSESTDLTRRRLAAEAQHRELEIELKTIDDQIARFMDPTELEEALVSRQSLAEALLATTSTREELRSIVARQESLSEMLARSEEWYDQRREAVTQLRTLAGALEIEGQGVIDPAKVLTLVKSAVERLRIDTLQGDEERRRIIRHLEDTLENLLHVEDLREAQVRLRSELQRLRDAEKDAYQVASTARSVRDLANEVKARLIREVFTARLNYLWADLFSRMVRNEWFLPRLDVETLDRGRLQAHMRAAAADEGVQAFDHLQSVLSAGNVNTAALSFFLALNLVQLPINRLLVLDDPVQSMDDLHAVEFANVLRRISRQTGRQILIAVHELPLLEYLEVELGPTSEGPDLITIKVHRDGDTSAVETYRRKWEGDRLQLPA